MHLISCRGHEMTRICSGLSSHPSWPPLAVANPSTTGVPVHDSPAHSRNLWLTVGTGRHFHSESRRLHCPMPERMGHVGIARLARAYEPALAATSTQAQACTHQAPANSMGPRPTIPATPTLLAPHQWQQQGPEERGLAPTRFAAAKICPRRRLSQTHRSHRCPRIRRQK